MIFEDFTKLFLSISGFMKLILGFFSIHVKLLEFVEFPEQFFKPQARIFLMNYPLNIIRTLQFPTIKSFKCFRYLNKE